MSDLTVIKASRDRSFNPKDWLKKRAKLEDAEHHIGGGDARVVDQDTGEHILTFVRLPIDVAQLHDTMRRVPFSTSWRTGGLRSTSAIFGFQPRITLRRDFCSVANLHSQMPGVHQQLIEYGHLASTKFQELLPEAHATQVQEVHSSIRKEWAIKDQPFTSGIVNNRNVLAYHRDAGNFPTANSMMISLTRDMGHNQGNLILPEYKLGLQFSDGAELLIFNGSKHVHGVTPINVHHTSSYRYTIVYYALRGLALCGTPDEELARIKRVKTQRARNQTSEKREEMAAKVLAGKTPEQIAAAQKRFVEWQQRKKTKKGSKP